MSVSGHCACGAVRFELHGELRDVIFCHCSKCRRWHGHVGAYTRLKKTGLIFQEQKGLKWHPLTPEARRGFCGECGSVLFFDAVDQGDTIGVTAGVLDAPTGLEPLAHEFIGSKGDYYGLPNDAPLHDEAWPPPPKP